MVDNINQKNAGWSNRAKKEHREVVDDTVYY